MINDTTQYKQKLEDEKKVVLDELSGLGVVKNKQNPDDWQAKPSDLDTDRADANEVGDKIESYEGNNALVHELETRLSEIDAALEKINSGAFGNCEVCDKAIEEDRLMANPAAKTCKQHMNN